MKYPFEFAKTTVQLKTSYGSNNPLKIVPSICRTQGIAAVYTGCSTLVVGATAKAAVRFWSFDTIKAIIRDDSGKLSPIQGLLAGMGAGAVESVFAVTPSERIKTALISDAKDAKRFRNGYHAMQVIFTENGLRGLYRGLLVTTLKQSATSAVRMGSYNALKGLAETHGLPKSTLSTFAIGMIAGTVTVYATQPFDTIKTRAQTSIGATTKHALKEVLKDSGLRGLWKGSTMRLGRLMFSGGIVFSVYEQVSSVLSGLNIGNWTIDSFVF